MTACVHRATVEDVEQLAGLFDAYRVFYNQPSDIERAHQFLYERLTKSESIVFFSTNDQDECVGFLQLYPSFSSVTTERVWILNDLYVAQHARRQGYAKLLMNRARDFAKEDGAKGLALETDSNNYNGQALYESLGYVKSTCFHYFLSVKD